MDLYDFQTEPVLKAIEGGFDLHVHCSPDFYPRGFDDFELARSLDRLGMAGAVLKSHHTDTGTRAWLVNKYSGARARLYGGVTLNCYNGGLNPYAVEAAAGLGARLLWMPTKNARNEQEHLPEHLRTAGICLLNDNGTLRQEVHDVLDIAEAKNLAVATGHISTAESVVFCREARRRGLRTVLTHPESPTTKAPLEVQKELAALGVFIEEEWVINDECKVKADSGRPDLDFHFDMNVAKAAARIHEIGFEHCILSSDAALPDYPDSPASIYAFAKCLICQENFSPEQVSRMTRTNTGIILDITEAQA